MKTYKLTRPEDFKGLFKVSLVDDPAIQSNLMHFSAEKEFIFQDEEQRIIYAPALIPNKLIFRKSINGEPANVYFDSETIKELHIEGMRNGYDSKVNLNHGDSDTDGIFCFEQWIIEDSVNDKTVKLGFELPVGTLMKGYKVDNNQVWQDIKDGKLKGLSIEGQLYPEEVRLSKNQTIEGKDLWFENCMFVRGDEMQYLDGSLLENGTHQLMTDVEIDIKDGVVTDIREIKHNIKMNKNSILKDIKDHQIKMKSELKPFGDLFAMELQEGEILSDADGNPQVSAEVTIDGKVYKTDDMGAIISIEDVAVDPVVEDIEPAEDLAKENADLKAEVASLKEQLAKSEADKIKSEQDLVTMKAQTPAANPIVNAPVEVKLKWDDMTPLQRRRANKE